MKNVNRLLLALHWFVGIGALGGGLAAITNPTNPMGMPAEVLRNSPFHDFLIPGIILFVVIGLGNLLGALMFRFRSKYQGYISSVFSWALVIWIVVQCIMLLNINILHVIFFAIGLVQAALSAVLLFEQRLFPANIVLNLYDRLKKPRSV